MSTPIDSLKPNFDSLKPNFWKRGIFPFVDVLSAASFARTSKKWKKQVKENHDLYKKALTLPFNKIPSKMHRRVLLQANERRVIDITLKPSLTILPHPLIRRCIFPYLKMSDAVSLFIVRKMGISFKDGGYVPLFRERLYQMYDFTGLHSHVQRRLLPKMVKDFLDCGLTACANTYDTRQGTITKHHVQPFAHKRDFRFLIIGDTGIRVTRGPNNSMLPNRKGQLPSHLVCSDHMVYALNLDGTITSFNYESGHVNLPIQTAFSKKDQRLKSLIQSQAKSPAPLADEEGFNVKDKVITLQYRDSNDGPWSETIDLNKGTNTLTLVQSRDLLVVGDGPTKHRVLICGNNTAHVKPGAEPFQTLFDKRTSTLFGRQHHFDQNLGVAVSEDDRMVLFEKTSPIRSKSFPLNHQEPLTAFNIVRWSNIVWLMHLAGDRVNIEIWDLDNNPRCLHVLADAVNLIVYEIRPKVAEFCISASCKSFKANFSFAKCNARLDSNKY